jgi:glycosyltransferase involved in cell wall biosynthesis
VRNIVFSPCPEWAEKLAAFYSGDLTPSDQEALDAHIASCQTCAAVLADYHNMDECIHRALSAQPLPSFTPQLLQPDLAPALEKSQGRISSRETISNQENHQGLPRITAVIPTLNEARNLYHVLPRIPTIVSEVILVDGHSTDDTVAVAQQLLPTIQVIEQSGKGKGDALKAGFVASTGDIIITLDGDGSADPNDIPRFVAALLAGNDFVKGSRFIQGGGSHHITPLRLLGSSWLNTVASILFKIQTTDLCHNYNAFWRHCLNYIEITDCQGFEVNTLITLRAHLANLRVVEVPSFEQVRFYGQSKLHPLRDGWRVLRTIIKERSKGIPTRTTEDYYTTLDAATKSIRRTVFIASWKNKTRAEQHKLLIV